MNIIITNTAGIPIYEQIKEQIKTAILSGEVADGELLPSIRQLARDLQVSVITTMRAYNDLEQEGYVANIQGRGCYVQPKNKELLREQKLCEVEESLSRAIAASKLANIGHKELWDMLRLLLEEDGNG
ncbi:MAG: GntR family transcriptional regulator [Christensenellaceae bacterium]|nr:GntR family transcriptional regulator [Christensenellaceae bacterium]